MVAVEACMTPSYAVKNGARYATVRIEHVKLLGAAHPVGGTAADRKLMLLARSVRSEGLAFDSDLAGIRDITRVSAPREAGCIKKPG